MRHVLVTGGAGFIGSNLVDALLAGGSSVTTVDNFDDFYSREIKERNIAGHRQHSNFRLASVDIRDAEALRESLPDHYDAIVHLAAKAGVLPSLRNPRLYQEVNVGGTQNMLDLARERGIQQFVFASSSSVYGVNPNVPWKESDPVLLPISPYAATKVAGELLGHVYSYLYGIRFLALRLFTVYGPRQRPDLAIHKFSRLVLDGKPIPIFGDGTTRRDYTYIANIVQGLKAALEYRVSLYEVINLGNSQTVALSDLVTALEQTLGQKARIDRQPAQPGDVPQTWASTDKARELLGYSPGFDLHSGLQRFAEWLRMAPVQP